MSWSTELTRSGLALVLALAGVVVLTRPAVRARLVGFAERFAALPRLRALAVVVVLTLGVRAALLPTFEPRYHADVKEYVDKAALLADEGTPRTQEVRDAGWHFYRTLGWALPLAGWFKVTGTRSALSARVFCIVLAGGIAVLITLLGAAAVDETTGRLAGLAYGVFLPHVQFALVPYSETWATLVTVVAALAFERLRRDDDAPSRGRLVLSAVLGLAVGALVITRAEFLWMPLLVSGLLLVRHRARARAWLLPVALVALGCAAPVAVNHGLRHGYPGWMRTSSQGGLILYFGNNPIAVPGHGNATPEVSRRVREMYAEDPTGALARREAMDWMRGNPGAVAANATKKAYFLWFAQPQGFGWLAQVGEPDGLNPRLAGVLRWAAHVQALVLLVLGGIGLVRGFRPAYRLWAILLVLHLGMWCLLAASPRNKYPLEPFLLVAGSAWLLGRKTD